jgi:hypothetical protein
MLVIATGNVLGLFPGETFAQSSAALSVTARIVAPCSITSENPRSSCSEQTLARQSDVTNASARISRSDDETVVTHNGGLPPRMEKQGNQLLVSF